MSSLLKSKIGLLSVCAVVIIIVGVTVGLSLNGSSNDEESNPSSSPITASSPSSTNPIALGKDYGFTLSVMNDNPVISSSNGSVRIQATVQKWQEGQDHTSETPRGDHVPNLSIEFATNMGFFEYSSSAKYQEKTDEIGRVVVPLVGGSIPGVATVTAKALDGSGLAASIQIYIVRVELAPVEVVINKNEQISFECTVYGVDDQDLLSFKWRNYNTSGYLKPQDSDYCYRNNVYTASKSPILTWQRYDGVGYDGTLVVEAFLVRSGHSDISLGTAQSQVHTQVYAVTCTLVGRITRGQGYYDIDYGCLIPKVDGTVGIAVRGSGFTDPVGYYTNGYGSGYRSIESLDDESGGYFLSIIKATSTNVSWSDAEIIQDIAMRFEGGVFIATPTFGAIE